MNVADSSGWLEDFADEPNADFFAGPSRKPNNSSFRCRASWKGSGVSLDKEARVTPFKRSPRCRKVPSLS